MSPQGLMSRSPLHRRRAHVHMIHVLPAGSAVRLEQGDRCINAGRKLDGPRRCSQAVMASVTMLTSKRSRRSGGSASEVGRDTRAVLDGSSVRSDAAGSGRGGGGFQERGALPAEGLGRGPAARGGAAVCAAAVAGRAGGDLPRLSQGADADAHRGPARRSVSTVSREVRRNTTSSGYRGVRADRMAQARTPRTRPGKLASNDRLREHVERGLKARWSPQQISAG